MKVTPDSTHSHEFVKMILLSALRLHCARMVHAMGEGCLPSKGNVVWDYEGIEVTHYDHFGCVRCRLR